MSGIFNDMPVILLNKITDLIEIKTIEDLYYCDINKYYIWSVKKFNNKIISTWADIIKIKKIKSKLRPFQLANSKNWLLATEDTKLLLNTKNITLIQNIRISTPLYSTELPYSNKLEITNCENYAPEPGEYISHSSIIGNKYCDVCDKVLACLKNSFCHYRHCLDCPDYDLCETCYQKGFINNNHKKNHTMNINYGYNINDYINAKNIDKSEIGLHNFRDPLRYYSIKIESFIDAQSKLLLAYKNGYDSYVDLGEVLTYISFDISYEALEEEYELKTNGQPFNKIKYQMIVNDRYKKEYKSVPFLHLRTNRFNGRRHLLPFGNNIYVNNFFRYNTLIGEHYIYNSELDYVFQIETNTGYYQAGVGGLIICN
jgi:hypothetical protein